MTCCDAAGYNARRVRPGTCAAARGLCVQTTMLRFYNTLSGKLEEFQPLEPACAGRAGRVRM
ncbi:MAG: hypothetical protein ACE10I_02975, partial [Candidatus Acidiferrales bacterium]